MKTYEPENDSQKKLPNWLLADQNVGDDVVLVTLVSDKGDDVVQGAGDGLIMDLKKERKDILYLCTIFNQFDGGGDIFTQLFLKLLLQNY